MALIMILLHLMKPMSKVNSMILKIKISLGNLNLARKRAKNIGNNKKKISPGGELPGLVCEEIFLDNFGGTLIDSSTVDIVHPKIGTIDIKTKRCSSAPKDNYTCTVASYQIAKADCEFYAFFRVHNNLDEAWFLGIISREEFLQKATFLKKGAPDGDTGFVAKADCYNILVSDLREISEVLKEEKV